MKEYHIRITGELIKGSEETDWEQMIDIPLNLMQQVNKIQEDMRVLTNTITILSEQLNTMKELVDICRIKI